MFAILINKGYPMYEYSLEVLIGADLSDLMSRTEEWLKENEIDRDAEIKIWEDSETRRGQIGEFDLDYGWRTYAEYKSQKKCSLEEYKDRIPPEVLENLQTQLKYAKNKNIHADTIVQVREDEEFSVWIACDIFKTLYWTSWQKPYFKIKPREYYDD